MAAVVHVLWSTNAFVPCFNIVSDLPQKIVPAIAGIGIL